jgi:hypothetical protein
MQTADAGTQGAAAPANALNLLFSTCSKYLRVRSAVDVNGTVATLDAQLQLTRGSGCGAASKIDVLRITLR